MEQFLNYSIRPVGPDDFPELAAMLDQVMTNGSTVEGLRAGASTPAPINRNSVAVDADDTIVGWSLISRSENEPKTRAFTTLIVHPQHRRLGIGSGLFDDVVAFCRSKGVSTLKSRVKDSEPAWLEWAKSKGFEIDRHSFRSSVKLADFDEKIHASKIIEAQATGITFSTLAELGDSQEDRQRFYDADCAAAIDIPGEDHVGTWAEYEAQVFKNNEYRPEGAYIALDGDRMVGVAHVWLDAEHNRLDNAFTGVIREYRGRGIATALKLLSIRYARELGIPEILTENDSENAPMLAVNRKLGYKPWPGAYGLKAAIE